MVVIQTPCISLISNIMKDKWEHYIPIEHAVLFSQKSLTNLMEYNSFQKIDSKTFGANAPISEIPEPYKTAYDTLAKKTNNGSTLIAKYKLNGEDI
jgi:hypothetical protein